MRLSLSFYLLLSCLLMSCGSKKETHVIHSKETLYCDYSACSNERVYCKIITRYKLDCDIIAIGEIDD